MFFPIPFIPSQDWRGGRGYGADRSKVAKQLGIPGGILKHGACDLVVRAGTPVLAIDSGVVLSNPYKFYPKEGSLITYAFEISHPGFIARYCEIGLNVEVKMGAKVQAGQVIAYVGDQPGYDMLHLELFSGNATGKYTTDRTKANAPFYRRSDLMDPTSLLDSLSGTADWILGKPKADSEGRKFLERRSRVTGSLPRHVHPPA